MKIRLIFLNSQELSVTKSELTLLLLSKHVLPYYAASLVYMWAVELYFILPAMPLSLYLAINFLIIISTLFVFLILTNLLIRIQTHRSKLPKVYVSLPFFLANIFVNISVFSIIVMMLNQQTSYLNILFVILNNIIVTEIILFIFSVYTLPLIISELNDEKFVNNIESDVISISGNSIRPDTIMYIKSDDAYLHIRTTSITLHVRGNVSDYAKMLKKYGVMTHRSFWINPKHALSIDKEGSTLKYVTMKDKIKVPVAKARSAFVEESLSSKKF